MGKYRKKPIEIEAMRYEPPPNGNIDELQTWGAKVEPAGEWGSNYDIRVYNASHDDWNLAHPGDWILRGIDDEFYPCEPAIFWNTYDAVVENDGIDGGSCPRGGEHSFRRVPGSPPSPRRIYQCSKCLEVGYESP
jgi:hypothetical protein